MSDVDLGPVRDFLACPTPAAWIEAAAMPERLDVLLIDHANCEKKAASTALSMLFRHGEVPGLAMAMSRLAREELRHFEQVDRLLRRRGIAWRPLSASRYAAGLRGGVRSDPRARLVDVLVCGAFVEARSAERFAALAPNLDAELGGFYERLLASEARHFEAYLGLAGSVADAAEVEARCDHFRGLETALVTSADAEFRFHSGVPA